MPVMLGLLTLFSKYAEKKSYPVEPLKLVIFAFSGITALIKASGGANKAGLAGAMAPLSLV